MMSRKITKPIIAILMIGVLAIGVAGFAVADGGSFFFVGSTNTVTQVNYPTTTSTAIVTTTPITTVTGIPYQILTTVTTSGAQTYTTVVTQTTTGATSTATVTANEEYYNPLAMYFVWSNNTGFYRQLSPWSATSSGGDGVTETVAGDGAVTMTINQVSTQYNDLGYYYVYQNLNLGDLATGGYSMTIAGTGNWGVNFYVNPQLFVWGPTGVPGIELYGGLGGAAYGLGSVSSLTTINSGTLFNSWNGACTGNLTVAQLISVCGLSPSTPFALWVGVGPINGQCPTSCPASITATITATYSTP